MVRLRKPNVESTTLDKRASNCSMIENIPPKGVIFSDFICTLAMSDEDLFDFYQEVVIPMKYDERVMNDINKKLSFYGIGASSGRGR